MIPAGEPSERAELAAATLANMAELVTANLSSGFSGAFVIVPPGDGELHTTLLLDPSENAAAFWSLVQTKAAMALAEMEDKERQGGFMGGRR